MRMLTNICSDNLEESKSFYVDLLGLHPKFDSDWYVQLCSTSEPGLEIGLIQRDHQLVPREFQKTPSGMYVTFVIDDVDMIYHKAVAMGLVIVQEPRNEFYGQRRLLLKDPSGCLIDISSPQGSMDE